MIEQLIKEFAEYRDTEKREDEYLLELRTIAEGVGAIQYGDDTSHGTDTGDRLERAAIRLAEAEQEIAKKRVPRFEVAAETVDWLHDKLKPEPARVMSLYVIEGLSYRDISVKTGRSVGWISNTIKEARKKL